MSIATEKTVVVDYKQPTQHKTITFLQYDTNVINFVVEDDGETANLSNITKIEVNFRRPDRKVISQILTAVGNEITYRLTDSEMITPGECELVLQLHDDDERLSIARFKVKIVENIESGEAPTVEEVRLITRLVESVDERLAELAEYDSQLAAVRNELVDKVNSEDLEGFRDEVTTHLAQDSKQRRKDVYGNFKQKSNTLNIVTGLDSLTAGTGSGESYTRWLNYVKEQLYTLYGYGGPGYVPFSNEFRVNEDDILSMGVSNLNTIESLTDLNDYRIRNSFDNKGLYHINAVGASIDAEVKTKWKYGKIFYLIQSGGGSFDVAYLNDYNTTKQTITTNGQSYSIGVVVLDDNNFTRGGRIAFRNITGNIAIFGGMFTNDEGVTISRIGKGGDTLAAHANKLPTSFNTFLDNISPDVLLLNAGSNDSLSNANFISTYKSYTDLFKNKSCEVVSMIPHSMSGQEVWKYTEQVRSVADVEKFSVLDLTNVLGESYEDALLKGNIGSDGIHQTDNGNRLYANKILTFLNVPTIAKAVNKAFSESVGGDLPNYYVELSKKELATHGIVSSSALAYDIGLRQTYGVTVSSGFVEIEVYTASPNTSEISVKKFTFPIVNSSQTENVATADASKLKETIIIDNAILGVAITLTSANNRVVVSVSSANTYADWVIHRISAKYVGISQYHAGSALIEN